MGTGWETAVKDKADRASGEAVEWARTVHVKVYRLSQAVFDRAQAHYENSDARELLIAELRHSHTNYEELLDPWLTEMYKAILKYAPEQAEAVHDILQQRANDAIKQRLARGTR